MPRCSSHCMAIAKCGYPSSLRYGPQYAPHLQCSSRIPKTHPPPSKGPQRAGIYEHIVNFIQQPVARRLGGLRPSCDLSGHTQVYHKQSQPTSKYCQESAKVSFNTGCFYHTMRQNRHPRAHLSTCLRNNGPAPPETFVHASLLACTPVCWHIGEFDADARPPLPGWRSLNTID
jgi:hypothetical protein